MSNYLKNWVTLSFSVGGYVDSFNGDDLLGDGSLQKPYRSLNRALTDSNSGTKVINGYFSEQWTGANRFIISNKFGNAIIDGKGIYEFNLMGVNYYNNFNEIGVILLDLLINISTQSQYHNMFIKTKNISSGENGFCIFDGIQENHHIFVSNNNRDNCIIKNCPKGSINLTGSLQTFSKCIFDNSVVWLTANTNSDSRFMVYNTCLFRVNCQFWAYNSLGDQVRVDNDSMTLAQKITAINDWISDDNNKRSTDTFAIFENCQYTENKIFNISDDINEIGKDLDYSLIWGDEVNYPACYMDGGQFIGCCAPAIKFEFKETSQLTSNPFEIEIKPEYNLDIVNGTLVPNVSFTQCEILSKIIPLPSGVEFNGINLSHFMGEGENRCHITSFEDFLDLSESNKITVTDLITYIPDLLNKSYYVKITNELDYAIYKGNFYFNGDVITAIDLVDSIAASENGEIFLYPMFRPSLFNSIHFKFFELDKDPPSNFLTDDNLYKWYDASCFIPLSNATENVEYSATKLSNGLRVLRDGNQYFGQISVGTDGRPLTSNHPEFFNNVNRGRVKFKINARRLVIRIKIQKI